MRSFGIVSLNRDLVCLQVQKLEKMRTILILFLLSLFIGKKKNSFRLTSFWLILSSSLDWHWNLVLGTEKLFQKRKNLSPSDRLLSPRIKNLPKKLHQNGPRSYQPRSVSCWASYRKRNARLKKLKKSYKREQILIVGIRMTCRQFY